MKTNTTELNNALTYCGELKISLEQNGIQIAPWTVHNKGENNLFLFFARCICGDFSSAKEFQPRYIKLLNYTEGREPEETETIAASLYTNTDLEIDNEGHRKAILHFTIPKSSCSKSLPCNMMGLYATGLDSADALATVTLDPVIEISTLSANTNILVDWEMYVTNPAATNRKVRRK